MKIKQHIITALCIICIFSLCMQSVFAASVEDTSAVLNEENYLCIHGVSPDGEGAYVTVTVTHPQLGIPFYIGEVQAGSDGIVDLKLKMLKSADLSGKYTVYLGGSNLDLAEPVNFIFINETDDAAICLIINNKTGGIKEKIDSIADSCGIERGTGTLFAEISSDGKTAVYDAMKSRTFSGGAELKKEFDRAAVLQHLKEKKNAAVMLDNGDLLGISVGTGSNYADLSSASKALVCNSMVAYNFSLANTAEVEHIFEKFVYTQLVNSVTKENRSKLIDYIEECNNNGYTTIDLTVYNNSFDDNDRLSVAKKVVDEKDIKLFENIGQVADAFNRAVTAVIEENAQSEQNIYLNKENISTGGSAPSGGIKVDNNYVPDTSNTPDTQGTSKFFTDTATVPWAVEAIDYLSANGIVSGVGDGKFEPDRYVTRAEFVHMIIKAFKIPAKTTNHTFADVTPGSWYYDSVMTAYASAVINGINETTFAPDAPITREQLCAVAYRAQVIADIKIETEQTAVVFDDRNELEEYAAEAVDSMYRAGIVNGVGDNKFAPKANATRAMAAKIIYEILERGNRL